MRSLHAHHHLCVVTNDADRGGRLVHLLIVDGQPVWPLLQYFRARNLDLSTEGSYAHAAGLLIDFIAARASEFADAGHRADLFTKFSHAVLYGTIRNGDDLSGLWWQPRSTERAHRLLGLACEISDWLKKEYEITAINPFDRPASVAEQIAFWRRWNINKATSLLSHTKSRASAQEVSKVARSAAFPGTKSTFLDRPPYFPEQHIERLLFDGFVLSGGRKQVLPWMRWNIRDIMITLLMHYGGLRVSEPFHLWVDDVFIDPTNPLRAKVLVHHPHDGIHVYPDPVTVRQVSNTRAAVLMSLYNRVPLTELTGKRHAGWKDSLLTNRERKAFEVFWYPRAAGEMFLALYRLYLRHVRPVSLPHPYLFVTEDGEPMGAQAFAKNHGRAVGRIGLTVSKAEGTSRHGHRHAYGQRLEHAGLTEKEIQVAMHHTSPLSQRVYTEPSTEEVLNALHKAEPRLPTGGMALEMPAMFRKG